MSCIHPFITLFVVSSSGKKVYEKLDFDSDQQRYRRNVHLRLHNMHEEIINIMRQTYEVFRVDGPEVRGVCRPHLKNQTKPGVFTRLGTTNCTTQRPQVSFSAPCNRCRTTGTAIQRRWTAWWRRRSASMSSGRCRSWRAPSTGTASRGRTRCSAYESCSRATRSEPSLSRLGPRRVSYTSVVSVDHLGLWVVEHVSSKESTHCF